MSGSNLTENHGFYQEVFIMAADRALTFRGLDEDATVRAILEETATETGERFFAALVENLSKPKFASANKNTVALWRRPAGRDHRQNTLGVCSAGLSPISGDQ